MRDRESYQGVIYWQKLKTFQERSGRRAQVWHLRKYLNYCTILVVGNSMLKGTEDPHWQPDRKSAASQEPTKVQNITKRGPQLVKNTDYYPLLLLYVDMNDSGSWNTGRIREDYKALGAQVKNTGAQIIIFLILPAGGKKEARNRHIMHIISQLCDWCQCEVTKEIMRIIIC